MFEKEAEEIANKRCHEIMCYGHCSFSSPKHHRCGEWHREYNCAKEGIEFGYNLAKEELEEENAVLERRIERAKECMKKLLFIINSDPANYNCKGLVKDAEDFIHNRTCNIRQQGQHCITEERCIMCDK